MLRTTVEDVPPTETAVVAKSPANSSEATPLELTVPFEGDSRTAEPADDQTSSAAQITRPQQLKSVDEKSSEARAQSLAEPIPTSKETHGTSAAEQPLEMSGQLKQDEIAGAAERHAVATDKVLPKESAVEPVFVVATTSDQLAGAETEMIRDVPSQKPSDLQAVSKTILEQAAVIRHSGAGSLEVVLKPDSHTHLNLRLSSLSDGTIEVSAVCENGDRNNLANHWPELRRVLQTQGVRLQDLEFNSSSGQPGEQNSQKDTRGWLPHYEPARHQRSMAGSLPENPSQNSILLAAQPQAGRTRLLESWA